MTHSFRQLVAALIAALVTPWLASPGHAQDGVTLTLGLGAEYQPVYFGSDEYGLRPAGRFFLQRLSIGPIRFGRPDGQENPLGFGWRGGFRIIDARTSADYPELTGLTDVDTAVELGLGVGYEAEDWRAFGVARYAVIGYNSTVVELGADWKAVNNPNFQISIGPRLFYGADRFVNTYFGVTSEESVASGLPEFQPGSGLVSAGLQLLAVYELDENWAVEGEMTYGRLQDGAADSPITAMGSADQASVSLILTRRFNLRF